MKLSFNKLNSAKKRNKDIDILLKQYDSICFTTYRVIFAKTFNPVILYIYKLTCSMNRIYIISLSLISLSDQAKDTNISKYEGKSLITTIEKVNPLNKSANIVE